jgi:hypothetical protein
MSGKGSARRKGDDPAAYAAGWDRIWKRVRAAQDRGRELERVAGASMAGAKARRVGGGRVGKNKLCAGVYNAKRLAYVVSQDAKDEQGSTTTRKAWR